MIYPPLNELMDKVDSRYTLVVQTAKRARELVDGAKKLTDVESTKSVTIAIHEIYEDKITYERTKEGIK
ncbi:MAG: DNA-directed RNA polymerase subunit omega [Clostridia bacterium]